jgi:starch synthase (maltosyl-transferring)
MTPRRSGAKRPMPSDGLARVAIEAVQPTVDGGRFAAKRTPGETVVVSADILADGHDQLAGVVRYRSIPDGDARGDWSETPLRFFDNDRWIGRFTPRAVGPHVFTVEAWVDAFESWRAALVKRVDAQQVTEADLAEGAALVRDAARRAAGSGDEKWLNARAERLGAAGDADSRAGAALGEDLRTVMRRHPDRTHATRLEIECPVLVERERARTGAWYEMFPRSTSPVPGRSGTFVDAQARLPEIAAMGFDVLYLPPIHPIGVTARKGPGNNPVAKPGDPGSPWAIGSADGGHTAVEPGLGTLEDFDRFVEAAREQGLEIALDLAYQCSPDHPWVREHPQWFRHRPDGSIKYAENPPKKYQDIYPIDFESADWPALWRELRGVVTFWAEHGVRIFRVDNPHTKPFAFWEWMIASVHDEYPDVVFLSEAFTRPKVMKRLAKLGFSQSYTYFTWRNTKEELTEYFTELHATDMREYFRGNLFANTPDILHAYLQEGGPPAFQARLVLAGTLGPSYGIYSGFELCENRAVPGTEEYLDSEKYNYRKWDWNQSGHIKDLVTAVNRARHAEPALQYGGGLLFHETDNPHIIAFSRVRDGAGVLVVVNLDPHHTQHGSVRMPIDLFGLEATTPYDVDDLLDGARYTWSGEWNYVRFEPSERMAHLLKPLAPPAVPDLKAPAAGEQLMDAETRTIIEQDLLVPYLLRQRWFGGKARELETARFADWSLLGSEPRPVFITIVEAVYFDGSREYYQLPLTFVASDAVAEIGRERPESRVARLGSGEWLCDAFMDDEVCRLLADLAHHGGTIPACFGEIVAEAIGHEKPDAVSASASIKRLPGTHSNSAVTLGDEHLLKIFRRLEKGLNPDVEIGRFLAEIDEEVGVPPLSGAIDYRSTSGVRSTLSILQRFVPSESTGWDAALQALDRHFELARSGMRHGEHPPLSNAPFLELASQPIPEVAVQSAGNFLPTAEIIGRRTAALHRALASSSTDEAFAPERASASDVAALTARMREEATAALELLEAREASLDPATSALARQVLDNKAALLEGFDVRARSLAGLVQIRVHGDYHLGQVLKVGDDIAIIDFEGEPTRSLEERRAKQSALRDVAGMLRSIGYAASAGLVAATKDDEGERARLEPWERAWETWTSVAFLRGYLEGAQAADFLPQSPEQVGALVDLFILEKAFYEVHYELNSRPDWVWIPLRALLATVPGSNGRSSSP